MSTTKKARTGFEKVNIQLPKGLHAKVKQWAKANGRRQDWVYTRAVEAILTAQDAPGTTIPAAG